jgi:hypothetical protein
MSHILSHFFRQYIILTRHFFRRLFLNDFVAFEDHMKVKVIGALAMLAVFSGHISNMILWKYFVFPENGRSWVEKGYLLTIFMILMGFISVLEWDAIFLDRRDFHNLCPLPIGPRNLFISKFTSLVMFVGLCAFSMASLSTIVFVYHLPGWHSNSLLYGLRYCAAHMISVMAACFFMFFVTVFIVGLLMTLLGYRLFSKISLYVRGLLLIVFVVLIFFVLAESFGSEVFPFSRFYALRENNSTFLYLFPPLWFVGMYETMIGNGDYLFTSGWNAGLFGLLFFTGVFFLVTSIGYRRSLRTMEGQRSGHPGTRTWTAPVRDLFNRIFLKNPVQRAVFYFFSGTLRKSVFHKMRLVTYGAVAVGFLLIVMTSETLNVSEMIKMKKTLIAAPLVLSFFLLIGLRKVIEIPVFLEANWVFKFTEHRVRHHYFAGLRKSIVITLLLPFFLLMAGLYVWVWSWQAVAVHVIFGFCAALLLMEGLLIRNHKIPFACSFLPGREKVHFYWLFYFLGFISYISILTALESAILRSPASILYCLAATLLSLLGIRIYQNRFYYPQTPIIYEEEPEVYFISLNINMSRWYD